MYYSDDIIEEVRSRNDIVGVIGQVVNLKKKSGRYFGLCPFHNEKTGSFSVSPDKQMYYCFGCGAGGNVISFVMEYENYGFQEAVQFLADKAGMTLPKKEESASAKKEASKKAKILELYKDAATYYYMQLRAPVGKQAKDYFAKRELTDETQNKFGLGYAPKNCAPLYTYLKSKGHTDEIIREAQYLKVDERGAWDPFWNRAIFPIMDSHNRVIGFGGRVMGEGEPKYYNSRESLIFDKSRNLYGLNFARSSKREYMLLCEGYMDVIALHQAGFDCAVASLGTAFTSGHASLIKRYVSEVILTFDSDGAGQKAILRAIPILKEAGLTVKTLDMKPYKDPDEFIKNLGAEAYEERIKNAQNAFFFETDYICSQYDLADPAGKTAFQREIASKLAGFSDKLERDNYLNAVSTRYSIKADLLNEMVNYIGSHAGSSTTTRDERDFELTGAGLKKKEKNLGLVSAEQMVLGYIAECGKSIDEIEKLVKPEYFEDEVNKRVADIIFAELRAGKKIIPAALASSMAEDAELRDKVAKIFNMNMPEDKDEAKAILTENIKLVKKEYLNRALRSETDPAKLQAMIIEKAKLDKGIVDLG